MVVFRTDVVVVRVQSGDPDETHAGSDVVVVRVQSGDPDAGGGGGHVAHVQPAADGGQPARLHHQVPASGDMDVFSINMNNVTIES